MPIFWLSLQGDPGTPCGLGVTATNVDRARGFILDLGIPLPENFAELSFDVLQSVAEIPNRFVAKEIEKAVEAGRVSLDREGVWFPVVNVDELMAQAVKQSVNFRYEKDYRVVRQSLKKDGWNPEEALLYGIGEGEKSGEVCLDILFPGDVFMVVFCQWCDKELEFTAVNEWYLEEDDEENFEPEYSVPRQMVDGRLKKRFEKSVLNYWQLKNSV